MRPSLCAHVDDTEELLHSLRVSVDEDLSLTIPIISHLGPASSLFVHNPISERIALYALAQGRRFVHHESRGYVSVPSELEPEVVVWEHDQNIPLWEEGVRKNPKHFCFRLDAVFPTFYPNYRSKWPAHELLHSLCGFFWSPDQTRFDCYLGARMAELFPLTHWYGLDEVVRMRCDRHRGKPPSKEYCIRCEEMFGAYTDVVWNEAQEEHSRAALEFAQRYYSEEKNACLQELEQKIIHPVPRILLDSSSDALGYLEGHWNRQSSWSFGAYFDLFVPESERHTDLEEFIAHIDGVRTRLLTQACPIPTTEEHERQHTFRKIQDIGKRALMILEWGDDDARESCWPLLITGADAIHAQKEISVSEWSRELHACLSQSNVSNVKECTLHSFPQTGLKTEEDWSKDLLHGFSQSFGEPLGAEVVNAFVASSPFWTLGHLWRRLPTGILNENISLEGWLRDLPHEDRNKRLFSMPFEPHEEGRLRINTTFRKGRFSQESMEAVLGWSEDADIIAFWSAGSPVILVYDDELAQCLSSVHDGTWRKEDQHHFLEELVSIGLLVWFPQRTTI